MSYQTVSLRLLSNLLLALSLLFPAGPAWAAPHGGEIMSMEQPDGSSVGVRVWGD